MDLETQICRSISLKAIYPLNAHFLHFSNLVASLRTLLWELTIVLYGTKQFFSPQGQWVHANKLQLPWVLTISWPFKTTGPPKPIGSSTQLQVLSKVMGQIYLSRSGGKMEGYHPVAVLMTFSNMHTLYIHSPSIGIGRTSSVWLSPVLGSLLASFIHHINCIDP